MYKGTHIRLSADFSVEIFQAQRDGMYLKWIERKKTYSKNTLASKVIIQNWRKDKKLLKQEFDTDLTWSVKGSSLSEKEKAIDPYITWSQTSLHAAAAKSLQSCLTLCEPIDGSPPGSPVPGILQARVLEWVAISFSRGSSQLRDRTQVSPMAGRRFTIWATREAQRNH